MLDITLLRKDLDSAIARLEEENEQFLSTYHQEGQQLGQVGAAAADPLLCGQLALLC